MNKHIIPFAFLAMIFALACKKDQPVPVAQNASGLDLTPYILEYNGLTPPMLPADNAITQAKVDLGRMLFYETKLSGDNTMACADCHKQEDAFSDINRFSEGINGELGGRQAMSVFNMAWNTNGFFWDGRAELLRHQSLLPIQDELEMDESLENVIAKLSDDDSYKLAFDKAFGGVEISELKLSLAMEAFMMTIVSNRSKYDQVLAGEAEFTPSEQNGLDLFFGEYNPFFPDDSGADCAHCHAGTNFENDLYMNNGLDQDADFTDLGRYNVTEDDLDKAKFKVTSLRNIELTPPYMHDGRFETLEQVVDHYNEGIQSSSTADATVINTQESGLLLTPQDKVDLVAFLKTLTDQALLVDPRYSSPF